MNKGIGLKNTTGKGAALMDGVEHECRIDKSIDVNSYPEVAAAQEEAANREALKEFIVETVITDLRQNGQIANVLRNKMLEFWQSR